MKRRTFLSAAGIGAVTAACPWLARPARARRAGVSPLEIRLGTSLGLSGPMGLQAYDFLSAFLTVLNKTNARAGIHHRQLTFFALDHGADPRRAVANTRTLIQRNDVMALTAAGSADALVRMLPLLRRAEAPPLLGSLSGLDLSRDQSPGLRRTLRPSFSDEMGAWARFWPRQARVAVCHLGDAEGRALTTALRRALAGHLAPPIEWISSPALNAEPATAQAYLSTAGVDTVVLALPHLAVVDWIRSAEARHWTPNFVLPSIVAGEAVASELERRGAEGRNSLFQSRVVPPLDDDLPMVTAFKSATAGRHPKELELWRPENTAEQWSAAGLQGYLTARAVVRSLEAAGSMVDRRRWASVAQDETLLPPPMRQEPAMDTTVPETDEPPETNGPPRTGRDGIWLTRLEPGGRWQSLEIQDRGPEITPGSPDTHFNETPPSP